MTEADLALLETDIANTIGASHTARVRRRAAELSELDIAPTLEQLVGDVQQEILDLHLRTVWPPCPAHPQHPLWFADGAWRCSVDASTAVALGSLPPPRTNPTRAR
jgi:hypothetical protein